MDRVEVIVISMCGIIVGCEGPTAIERWAKAKQDWLKQVLKLPNGIPSHDCIHRILLMLKPEAFQQFRNGRDFIRLFVCRHLSERDTMIGCPSTDQM